MTLAEFRAPKKLRPILAESARYKVAHGGRGSAKSWTFARGILLKAMEKPRRVLCAREIQKSIKDSVHRLLSDQIDELGLGGAFQVLDTEIRGYNGSLISFSGLQGHTVDSLKSFEGADICWIEEAQTVSKQSMQILTPTVRKEGSEIWMSLNPRLDTDYVWENYVLRPPPDSIVIEQNYTDNPYFPEVLEQERLHAKATMTVEDYENIWEGKPRSTLEGAIYAGEVDAMIRGGRVRPVPYDPSLKVHTIWDLGFNDNTSIILVQRVASEIRVIQYIEDSHKTLDYYAGELNAMKLNWGKDWLPHDGFAATLAAGGQSVQRILKRLGRDVAGTPIPNVPVETGIKVARMMFPRVYVDSEYGARLLECLKRYRRNKPATTGEEGGPVHDEYSHGCLVAGSMVETSRGLLPIEQVSVGDQVVTPVGFAQVTRAGVVKIADTLIEITTEDGGSITVTPEHKFFTTSGIVVADTLRYADGLITAEGSQCEISSGLVNRIGYRAAFSETMQAFATGSGRNAGTTSRRSKAFSRCCTEWFTWMRTALLPALRPSTQWMEIGKTFPLRIWLGGAGHPSGGNARTLCRSSTEPATTGGQPGTTRRIPDLAVSTCTGLYGRFTTERFLPATTSTMSMAIVRTTRSAILNYCPQAITRSITLRRTIGLGAMRIGASLLKRLNSLWLGTGARRVTSGIPETAGNLGRNELGLRSRARSAERNTSPHGPISPGSVTRIANKRRFAAAEPVYDLTVKHHHCYFANGLLVSNSDAWRYLALAEPMLTNDNDSRDGTIVRNYVPHERRA